METLNLLKQLVRRRSITPIDAGCMDLLRDRLLRAGFSCQMLFAGPDSHRVTNFWAIKRGYRGEDAKVFAFVGHTDVVPPGPNDQWGSDPFEPSERGGRLYGRGVADMKASIAAFVVAVEEFLAQHESHRDTIAIILTSDEEGPGADGTVKVVEMLDEIGQRIDYCLVGEPTSEDYLGDTVKNGRRGSLSATLHVLGIQGHVAYPALADNPIHTFSPALQALISGSWDDGNEFFPPTSLQISNIHAGSGATNVIPGQLTIEFNFRYSTASTAEGLKSRVEDLLRQHVSRFELEWRDGARPFLTAKGRLLDAAASSIQAVTGRAPRCSTAGGTSDGRYLAAMGAEVVEFGPPNGTIHMVDESIEVADVQPLTDVYRGILERLVR